MAIADSVSETTTGARGESEGGTVEGTEGECGEDEVEAIGEDGCEDDCDDGCEDDCEGDCEGVDGFSPFGTFGTFGAFGAFGPVDAVDPVDAAAGDVDALRPLSFCRRLNSHTAPAPRTSAIDAASAAC